MGDLARIDALVREHIGCPGGTFEHVETLIAAWEERGRELSVARANAERLREALEETANGLDVANQALRSHGGSTLGSIMADGILERARAALAVPSVPAIALTADESEQVRKVLRRGEGRTCACGHPASDHRFQMDGGSGWCTSEFCKCDEFEKRPDEAYEAALGLLRPSVAPVAANEPEGGVA